MTTPLSNVEALGDSEKAVKAVWTRPVLEVAEINSSTEGGGAVSADSDPNQPS